MKKAKVKKPAIATTQKQPTVEFVGVKQMKQTNMDWLEEHRPIWNYFAADQVVRNGFDFKKALDIIREEFNEKANYCVWCPEDMGNLMEYLYTQYDNYLLNQKK